MRKLFLNDNFILALIVLNSLLIFYLSFIGTTNLVIVGIDHLFTAAFVFEMVVKISYYKKDFFKRKSYVFDFVIILITVLSLIFSFDLEYLLIIRLFRCFRLYKIIPNYSSLIKNFKVAIKASIGLIFGMAICMVILGIILCNVYKDIAPEYFNTPGESIYNVFRLISIEGWYDIPNDIADKMVANPVLYYITKYLFVIIVFMGILGLSFVTSIFSDKMAEDNNDEVMKKLNEIERLLKERNE